MQRARNWRALIRPKALEFETEVQTPNYGKFLASPLERGFGTTLGNALRRVLLSSLQGAAVTHVRLDGVQHEFSAIHGIVEDVTEMFLNIRQLRLKLHEGNEATLRLEAKGSKQIKARDLELPSNVEVLNPDLHLATLGGEGKLKGELICRLGKGYVVAEQNKRADDPVGLLSIDSVFSPVTRVNYTVTNARVGQRADYDRLTLEVWTNGSVTPQEAVGLAAKILKDQLQLFIPFEEVEEATHEALREEETPQLNPNLYRRVDELELSVRSANCLANTEIKYIGELVQKSEGEMLKTKNFGRKSLNEIKEILAEMGLTLGMKIETFAPAEAEKYRPKEAE